MTLFIDGPVTGPINLSVGTTAVLASTGTFPVGVKRKAIRVQPISNSIYWGYDSSVTAATGFEIGKGNIAEIPVGSAVEVYLIASAGTVSVRVSEEG